jgi:hypothetical protein
MTDMKRILIGLLAALPTEAVNFWLLPPPIDVGFPPGTPWYINLIGFQWVVLHFPGLLLLDRLERVVGCQQLNIVMGCRRVDVFVLFVSGYVVTALLLIAVILGFRRIPHLVRRYSAGRN